MNIFHSFSGKLRFDSIVPGSFALSKTLVSKGVDIVNASEYASSSSSNQSGVLSCSVQTTRPRLMGSLSHANPRLTRRLFFWSAYLGLFLLVLNLWSETFATPQV